jgi:hypothetical protein
VWQVLEIATPPQPSLTLKCFFGRSPEKPRKVHYQSTAYANVQTKGVANKSNTNTKTKKAAHQAAFESS